MSASYRCPHSYGTKATSEPSPVVEAGSSPSGDDAEVPALRVSSAAAQCSTHAVGRLHAVQALLFEAKVVHSYAPYSLLRAAVEAAGEAIWLLERSSRQERIHRCLKRACRSSSQVTPWWSSRGPRTRSRLGWTGSAGRVSGWWCGWSRRRARGVRHRPGGVRDVRGVLRVGLRLAGIRIGDPPQRKSGQVGPLAARVPRDGQGQGADRCGLVDDHQQGAELSITRVGGVTLPKTSSGSPPRRQPGQGLRVFALRRPGPPGGARRRTSAPRLRLGAFLREWAISPPCLARVVASATVVPFH